MDPHTTQSPWYRHGWPWFLFLLPASVVVASFVTLWIALSHPQSLVRDDYYKDGLALNRDLARTDAASARGLRATLDIDPATGAITVTMPPDPALSQTLRLELLHPTDALLDQALTLQRDTTGAYTARLAAIPDGKRHLRLGEIGHASPWLLRGVLNTPPPPSTVLLPAAG